MIEDCEAPGRVKRSAMGPLCPKHYSRFWKHGDPFTVTPAGRVARSALDRLMTGFDIDPDSGCWVWRGVPSSTGYAIFRDDAQQSVLVHRWAYVHFRGLISEGLTLDHDCHTRDESCPGGVNCLHRRCVYPMHLVPMTRGENTLRGKAVAALAARTHCDYGHPFSGDNLFIDKKGVRHCRMCMRASFRRWYWRKQGQSEKTGVDRKERFRGGTS